MSDVEVRVSAILEKIVDISVMEIGKIVGVSESRQPEESACSAETAQKSSSEMVGKTCFLFMVWSCWRSYKPCVYIWA